MPLDFTGPLSDVDPEAFSGDTVDESAVRSALASSNPLVQQRGVEVCEALAEQDVDAIRPLLDDVAALADDSNSPIALRTIATLDVVGDAEPTVLDGRVGGVASAADAAAVDVQLTAATLLGKVVVDHPDLIAPNVRTLAAGVRATEPADFGNIEEFVDHPGTLETIAEHERGERERRASARRMLVNVVVAVAEMTTESAFDAVDPLAALLDDEDPEIVGGAVDALGELAAADPAVVVPAVDRLRDCLDHYDRSVRARTIRVIGRRGDPDVVDALRTLADEDDDETVRELAEETAAFLAGV
jgi:HEAT repeat protein